MSTPHFRRSQNPDADHLHTLLDTMRSCVRAPDTASATGEASDLAATASQIRRLDDRARIAAGASEMTFNSIWEDMMSAHAHATTAPIPFVDGPSGQSTAISQRIYPAPPQAKISRLQSFLSAAIVTIMIAGLVSAAWNLRGSGGGDDQGENPRLAATALDGTPEATAEGDFDFLTYIDPLECNARATLTDSERAAFLKQDHDWALAEYGPISQPNSDDAQDAALVAREFAACGKYRSGESLMTDRFIWERYSLSYMNENYEEAAANKLAQERRVSSYLTGIIPSDLFHITDQVPTGGQSQNARAYVPETAVQFPDGRIGVPTTLLVTRGDPTYVNEAPSTLMVGLDVLSNTSGEWLLDDQLMVCIGICEDFINGGQRPLVDLRVDPDGSTPIASPLTDSEWLDYIQPEECTADPLSEAVVATIVASPDAGKPRVYTPLTTPDAVTSERAATAARSAEACGMGLVGDPAMPTALMSERFIAESASSGVGYDWEPRERSIELGKQISAAYPESKPADLVHFSKEVPADTTFADGQSPTASIAFLPSMAVQLPDGRVGFPAVSLLWQGNPNMPTQEQIDTLPWLISGFVVLTDTSGTWQVDELLPICFGECEEGWAMWSGEATPEAATPESLTSDLRPLPGTPIASPDGETDWLLWMTPEECTVEPMTTEEYAEIMRNEPVWPSREYSVVGTPEPDTAHAAATIAREHEVCNTYRMTDQKRALESPSYIYVSNNGIVANASPQEQHLDFVQRSQELSSQMPNQDPQHYIVVSDKEGAPSSGFGGNVYLPENALLLSDGRVVIPATKLFAGDPGDIFLPGGMIILTNESGEWLVDEALNLCVGDCDDYWTQSMGPTANLTASPAATPIATPVD